MPYIEENQLLELHNIIDKSNEERDEFETVFRDVRDKNKRLKKERNLLMRLSVVSSFFLLAIVAFYFLSPNLFIQNQYLEDNGLATVKQEVLGEEEELQLDATNLEALNNDAITSDENAEFFIEETNSNALYYVVQIAASEVELTHIFHHGLEGLKETEEDGYYKYFIGDFETLAEAQENRRVLLEIGFEDAFVASYKNDKRFKIEEAYASN